MMKGTPNDKEFWVIKLFIVYNLFLYPNILYQTYRARSTDLTKSSPSPRISMQVPFRFTLGTSSIDNCTTGFPLVFSQLIMVLFSQTGFSVLQAASILLLTPCKILVFN